MINVNKVVLIGRLTKDVEVKKTENNTSVCSFTVAVNRWNSEADFIGCTAWKNSADFLGQYAHKGDIVSVEGRIQTRSYEGKNGTVYETKVVAENVQLISDRKEEKKEEKSELRTNVQMDMSKTYQPRLDGRADEEYWKIQRDEITDDDLPFM